MSLRDVWARQVYPFLREWEGKQESVFTLAFFELKKRKKMALRVRRIKKAFGFDKTKTEKYVLVPDRATVVDFEALCDQVAAVSGINLGMVQSVVYGLVKSMKTFIRQGHSVQVSGFGTFVPSFNAKSSLDEKEVNVDSIHHVKLRFLPSVELRAVMHSMDFEFDVVDSTKDSKATSEGEDPGDGTGSESPDEI